MAINEIHGEARMSMPDNPQPSPRRRRGDVLPHSCPPRGLSREEAAAYVGVSPSLFDSMVKERRMPRPKRINARTIWDRFQLDAAFSDLPSGEDKNPWDEE